LIVVPISQIFGSPDHRTLIVREGRVLRLIGVSALLVLLGGCATVMALVFVHYERRRSEFAVRLAIGASAARLARRLFGELACIVTGGVLLSGLAAYWGLTLLPKFSLPGGIDLARLDLGVDWRALLAGISATAATMIAAAALPMRRFTTNRIVASLASSETSTATRSSLRTRQAMLAVHVCFTVVVVIGAGLFIRTVQYGFSEGPGFDVAHTLFAAIDIGSRDDVSLIMREVQQKSAGKLTFAEQVRRSDAILQDRLRPIRAAVMDSVRRDPRVEVLALGPAPLGPDASRWMDSTTTFKTEENTYALRAGFAGASLEYLDALGLTLIAGRAPAAADARPADAGRAVFITVSLAAALWPGQSPLGRRVQAGSAPSEVIGVVHDFAFGSMRFDPHYVVLSGGLASDSAVGMSLSLVIRTRDPEAFAEPLRRQLADLVPNAPYINVRTGRDLVAADLGRERLGAVLFSGFGCVTLALGAAGVFGIVAYLADSRREFGIRAALGATTPRLARMAIAAGMIPVSAGTCAGILGALGNGEGRRVFPDRHKLVRSAEPPCCGGCNPCLRRGRRAGRCMAHQADASE